jgi:hypothetical protein
MQGGRCSVDEVSFGRGREIRLPSRYRRFAAALAAAVAAGGIAVGVVLAMTGAGAHDAAGSRGTAAASVAAVPLRPACPPAQPTRPSVAGLPAGMRPGALKVVSDAQFSGRCAVSR